MGRRRVGALDAWLEQWARWLAAPSSAALGSGRSMLARWMDSRGELTFGGSTGSSAPADGIETRIELAAVQIGRGDPLREDVLRIEHDAGWWAVTQRRGIKGYDPRGLCQLQKSLHLGISLRTYKRRLAEARAELIEILEGKR